MAKSKITKVVGKISYEIAEKYNLQEYSNQDIVQSLDLYIHIAKHAKEFKSIDSYNYVIFHVSDIISDPYYVYYDSKRHSLLYFKEMNESICAVVKLKLKPNGDNYVSTIYPISKNKVQKYIEKSYIIE